MYVFRRRHALFILIVFSATGCQTVKGWLRPYVCECQTPLEHATTIHDEYEEDDDPDLDPDGSADKQGEDLSAEQADVTEPDTHDAAALEEFPIELGTAVNVADPKERDRVKRNYLFRGEADDGRVVLEGEFSSRNQAELAVIDVGKTFEVYSDSARVAQSPFLFSAPPKEMGPFVVSSQLVRDGRAEIITRVVSTNESGQQVLELAIWKVIGGEVAIVFRKPLARLSDGKWVPVGNVHFLTGQRNRFIEYVPNDANGQPGTPEIYRWNRWEGLFRIPKPVPTAPLRSESPFSTRPRLVTAAWIR